MDNGRKMEMKSENPYNRAIRDWWDWRRHHTPTFLALFLMLILIS